MTKTKLALATAIAAVLAFGVAACGPKAETTTTEEAPAVTEPAASTEAPAVDPAAVAPATDPAAAPAATTETAPAAPAPEKK
jgi:ABC-type oligopeptide transport system substrate-binding subunit